ncbi:unnamed protein product [Cercopithifilaria johnstoni]|uniref:Uncharacterized protein n=1 Tax=Cercopithifilaria johnstoni TaxID=2874296 RepID=A0A8J2MBV8_9BILA|nr:unnamed protein product [Cercopithifilaria johnstoni]
MEEFEWPPSTSALQTNFTSEVWTVGLTCVTVISLCAAVGILFVKKLSKRTYNHFITVLVAVGVGSLITSSTLHLLPQGLGVVDGENYDFIMVMMFCIFGIYIFFFCDKFIKITLESKKMNEIEMMNNAGTHKNMEAGVVSIRSTDALITENGICIRCFIVVIDQPRLRKELGNLKPDALPSSERINGYKKRTSLWKQSGEIDSMVRSSFDMSRQTREGSFTRKTETEIHKR